MIRPAQNLPKFGEIVVGKNAKFGAGKSGGIDDAGMHQFVEDDDIVRPHQGANGSQRRGIAGGKNQGGRGVLKAGEGGFQFMVWSERAANEARSAGTATEAFNGGGRGLF